MLELEAGSVEDAVAQALRGAASGGNVVPPPRENESLAISNEEGDI